jgi:hypothetical protein
MAPIHTQKLILFLMLRGVKNITLTLGNIFYTSLESFAMVKLKFLIHNKKIEFLIVFNCI